MLDHAFIDRQALPRNEKRLLTHGVIEESHLPKTLRQVMNLLVKNGRERLVFFAIFRREKKRILIDLNFAR